MPRDEEANQRLRDLRKEHMLRTAAAVFANNGYAATKIEDIAAAADMSKGLVYHYFKGKEEVFRTLVQRSTQSIAQLSQHVLEREGTPWEKLHSLTTQILEGLHESPDDFLVILQVLTSRAIAQDVRDLVARSSDVYGQIVRQLITEGQAAGQIVAGDVHELELMYSAIIQGLAVTAASLTNPERRLPAADVVLRFLKA